MNTNVVIAKLTQYLVSIFGGLLLAFETSLDYFVPCLLAIALDIFTAWMLDRRVHRKYPENCDGKFKSEYKYRVMITLGVMFVVLILAAYVDILVRRSDDQLAVRVAMGAFLFYEGWSCLENWSSENDTPFAKALQRIMVNKAERHLDVPLSDILLKEKQDNQGKEEGK
ncbi:MAG: phage holin family protein [Prevotella sp.]|nr:phage holin family protein [Prevotella sp.]